MKIYFIANGPIDPEPLRASNAVNEHHVFGPFGSGTYVGVCFGNGPAAEVRALLRSIGAEPLPALMGKFMSVDVETHAIPLAFAGVTAADSTWAVAEKLHAALPWCDVLAPEYGINPA